jgi:hypothetical protein
MKELQKVMLTILIVGSHLVAMAAADPAMTVSEQPTDIAIGETFVAEVTVDPAGTEIYAAEYDLHFDPTILEAIEQTQGTFLSHGDVETILAPISDEINNSKGMVQYAETRVGDPETVGGATESGILASVTFEVIGDGISDLTLSGVEYVKPEDLEQTTEPPASSSDDTTPDTSGSSHISSGGSSGYTPTTTSTATPTELPPTTSAPPSGEVSGATEDHITTHTSGETDSMVAESVPTAVPAETPLRPESMAPGFASPLAIVCLLAMAILMKSRSG